MTATYSYVHSTHLRTGGYDSEEAWQRNYIITGNDPFGRSILQESAVYQGGALQTQFPTQLDPTLPTSNNETASFSHGNYQSLVVNLTKRFSNHFQLFANYIWSQNQDNAASERDTDTYFGQQDPINLAIDYGRNGLDITQQFKAAGVYELPWGFEVSSSLIAHSGVPFPSTSPKISMATKFPTSDTITTARPTQMRPARRSSWGVTRSISRVISNGMRGYKRRSTYMTD